MSTYLQLCQDMAREVGIPGTGPSSVSPTAEEEQDIVRQVRDADLSIQRRWFNWNFLWAQHNTTTVVSDPDLPAPADLLYWNIDSVVYNPNTNDYQPLVYVPWPEYRDEYKYGVVDTGTPELFSIRPDNTIDLYPTPDSATALSAEYWKTPTALAANGDISAIPASFHRIIICRAKVFYAEQNDAPEIMASSVAEFNDLLDKLEAAQLPGQRNRRFSQVQDLANYTVVTE